MTQIEMFPTAISSPLAFHVSRGQSLVDPEVLKERKKTLVTSGRGLLTLLNKKDPLGLFLKMCLTSPHWGGLTRSSLTWKLRITQRQRLIFQLSLDQERPTKENDCGSLPEMWATPNTMDHLPQRSKAALQKRITTTRKGRKKPCNLREQVDPETVKAWEQSQQPEMWPTPATRDHKGGYQGGRMRNGKVSWDTLDVAVQYTDNQSKTGGQLNPQWVEWLMGYPEGWTELKD